MEKKALHELVSELLAARGEGLLPLVTLDSGARYGLDVASGSVRWIIDHGDGRPNTAFSGETAHLFHEALEWKRDRFDNELEESARSFGLSADDVVFSYPVFDVARAIFAKKSSFLTRLMLEWLRPTELRELRVEIKEVIATPNMPRAVIALAERLVVPD